MSGEQGSREALTPEQNKGVLDSFLRLSEEKFREYVNDPANLEQIERASDEVRETFLAKVKKWGVGLPGEPQPEPKRSSFEPGSMAQKAPAVIKERMKSDPPKPPESQDIEYLSWEEASIGAMVNTLDYKLVEAPELGAAADHYIERCLGINPETLKLRVVRIPAKRLAIRPEFVLRYCGSVVQDHQAVHTANVVFRGRRWGYSFDRFFTYNGKRYERCCLVDDRIHMAGIIFEKFVPKGSRRAIARLKRLKGGHDPMYKIVKSSEGDVRDYKRLFERHFLGKNDRVQDEDPALARFLSDSIPLIATE